MTTFMALRAASIAGRGTKRHISSASFFPLDSPDFLPTASAVPPQLPHTSVKPPLQTYFTSKPGYIVSCQNLERAVKLVRTELFKRGIIKRAEEDTDRGIKKVQDEVKERLKGISGTGKLAGTEVKMGNIGAPEHWGWERTWRSQLSMGEMFGDHFKLSITEYKRLTKHLNDLASLIPSSALADELYKEDAFRRKDSPTLGDNLSLVSLIHRVITPFQKGSDSEGGVDQGSTRAKGGELGSRSPRLTGKIDTPIDDYGRASAFGRRKESSCRVWMIRVLDEQEESMQDVLNPSKVPSTETRDTFGRIIINGKPLSSFSNSQVHKATILRPLVLTGQLGRYNIFAATRGGGLTGQSGSLALAISRCLVLLGGYEGAGRGFERELILRRAKLLTRDKRMVERKKWGRHKARKGKSWVRR